MLLAKSSLSQHQKQIGHLHCPVITFAYLFPLYPQSLVSYIRAQLPWLVQDCIASNIQRTESQKTSCSLRWVVTILSPQQDLVSEESPSRPSGLLSHLYHLLFDNVISVYPPGTLHSILLMAKSTGHLVLLEPHNNWYLITKDYSWYNFFWVK